MRVNQVMAGEFSYISWLRHQITPNARVELGPGDDAAVLHPIVNKIVLTTDMLMDGTDFHLHEVGYRLAGRKAMAVNLSDIAAMAGVPVAALVSFACPNQTPEAQLRELYFGLSQEAEKFQVSIVGGDTNSWTGPFAIAVTVLGESTTRGPVPRSGAKPGDWVFVTGPLGGSILGHHLHFKPRVTEALLLHSLVDLHAMIDISDGLTADLAKILEESRCGAVLDATRIPVSPAAQTLAQTSGKSALEHALGDGEDFELLFTVSPTDGQNLLDRQPLPGVTLTKIGECLEAEGLWLERGGIRERCEPVGWVHRLGE